MLLNANKCMALLRCNIINDLITLAIELLKSNLQRRTDEQKDHGL